MPEQSAKPPVTLPRASRWRTDGLLGNALFCALAASILVVPQITGPAAAFAIVGLLMVLGLLALVDVDRSLKAGLANPLALHAASLLLGVLAGGILGLPRKSSIPWMMPSALLAIQMQVYFLMLGLSMPVRARDQFSGMISTLFCLQAYVLACPKGQVIHGLLIPVDINAAIIFIAGAFGGLTANMGAERDAITMSRKFPITWAASSMTLMFLWWLISARA
jgi:hypothetical protein